MKRILLVILLLLPVASLAIYKPIRVIAPGLVGAVSCVNKMICIDDISRLTEAEIIYNKAIEYVSVEVGEIKNRPRVIYCSLKDCFNSFGFDKAAAKTVGKFGIVVSPRGWDENYIRHEMIHHLQSERLGVIKQWKSPAWFKEGMAYSLSQDPRKVLIEPWQSYRKKFEIWLDSVGKENLWQEADKLASDA